jgi:hypothetical protein
MIPLRQRILEDMRVRNLRPTAVRMGRAEALTGRKQRLRSHRFNLGRGFWRLKNGELMTQGDKLKPEVIPRAEERAEPREESREKTG